MAALAAPTLGAEIQHLLMAAPPLVAVFIVRKEYFPTAQGAVEATT